MRHLNKPIVNSILKLNPKSVQFHIVPSKYVLCEIITNTGIGKGVSLCSVLDKKEFDLIIGKRKAAGRAIKALVNKIDSGKMRSEFKDFPDTWTKEQISRIMDFSALFKYQSRFSLL